MSDMTREEQSLSIKLTGIDKTVILNNKSTDMIITVVCIDKICPKKLHAKK